MVALTRLDDDDRAVEARLLVHLVDNPVDESAKEVTFPELYDALGRIHFRCSIFIENLHD